MSREMAQLVFACRGDASAICETVMEGVFITFEGVEGSGKTTQIKLLAEYLKNKGRDVVLTREPGGTPIGDKIRAILLDSAHSKMTPITELLLYSAGRNQHIAEVIRPALDLGKVVLCDRYADATTAYQGAAREIDPKIIKELHAIATGGLMPKLTILLDCGAREGLRRARSRNESAGMSKFEGRFEDEEIEFHKRVRDGYLKIASAEPNRVKIIDAGKTIEEIHKDVVMEAERILDVV